jgi:hypothetical protein
MGAANAQKTPLARSLNQFAEQRINGYMQFVGRNSLPAQVTAVNGSIVTVSFQVTSPYTLPTVTVPIVGSEYIRLPIQKGCTGMVQQADAYLGGVTGLGGGMADLSIPANLSSLVFLPLGSKNFSATDNPNAVVIYGPDGVIIRDTGKKNTFTLTQNGVTLTQTAGGFVITVPAGQAVTINGALVVDGNLQLNGAIQALNGGTYAGNIETAGDIVAGAGGADSVTLQNHVHAGVTTGGGSTDPPTAGT